MLAAAVHLIMLRAVFTKTLLSHRKKEREGEQRGWLFVGLNSSMEVQSRI